MYNFKQIIKNLTVKKYDNLTGKREFYEATSVESRAYPAYLDITAGFYTRYFACRTHLINIGPVREIDANQFSVLSSNPNYAVVQMQWRIRGSLEDVTIWVNEKEVVIPGIITQNKAVIEYAAITIPAIKSYFYKRDGSLRNPQEYYLGEFTAEDS